MTLTDQDSIDLQFRFSSIPQISLLSQNNSRNASSLFRFNRSTGVPQKGIDFKPQEVIVLHPGSSKLRVGLATEALPQEVYHVIARRCEERVVTEDLEEYDLQQLTEYKDDVGESPLDYIQDIIAYRLQNAKRRAVPNAKAQVSSFNSHVEPEKIADHNDAFRVEWTNVENQQFVAGIRALYVKNDGLFKVRFPIRRRRLNFDQYSSIQELEGDMADIWLWAIESTCSIKESDLKNYVAIVVVPDSWNRLELNVISNVICRLMGFKAFGIIHESVSATYGAGISSGLVIDMGAQSTSVACVEDGIVISKNLLPYGGDEMAAFLLACLKQNQFPYHNCHIQRLFDYELVNDLKERFATLHETDLNVHVLDFFVRHPDKATLSYQFKSYDEMMVTSMSFLYPKLYQLIPLQRPMTFGDKLDMEHELVISWQEIEATQPVKKKKPATVEQTLPSSEMNHPKEEEEDLDIEEDEDHSYERPPEQMDKSNKIAEETFTAKLESIPVTCMFEDCCENVVGFSSLCEHFSQHLATLQVHQVEHKSISIYSFKWNGEEVSFCSKPSIDSFLFSWIMRDQGDQDRDQDVKMYKERDQDVKMYQDRDQDIKMTDATEKATEEGNILGVDEAIFAILKLENSKSEITDRTKRLLQSVLVVGGTSNIKGLGSFMQERLQYRLSLLGYEVLPNVEVLISSKDMDPKFLCWKGGSVLARLEPTKEMWITNKDYLDMGTKALQAKVGFIIE